MGGGMCVSELREKTLPALTGDGEEGAPPSSACLLSRTARPWVAVSATSTQLFSCPEYDDFQKGLTTSVTMCLPSSFAARPG